MIIIHWRVRTKTDFVCECRTVSQPTQKENHSCWIAIASNALYGRTGFAMNTDWCNTVDRSLLHHLDSLFCHWCCWCYCMCPCACIFYQSCLFRISCHSTTAVAIKVQHPHILLHGFTCMLCVLSSCAHITHSHTQTCRQAGRISSVALFMFRQTCNVHIKLVMSSLYCVDLWLDTNGYQLSFYLFFCFNSHSTMYTRYVEKNMPYFSPFLRIQYTSTSESIFFVICMAKKKPKSNLNHHFFFHMQFLIFVFLCVLEPKP